MAIHRFIHHDSLGNLTLRCEIFPTEYFKQVIVIDSNDLVSSLKFLSIFVGDVKSKGIVLPMEREVYQPLLHRLQEEGVTPEVMSFYD